MGIDGVKAPESIVEVEKTSTGAASVVAEASEGVQNVAASVISAAAEAAATVLADTDGDGQEHNEL